MILKSVFRHVGESFGFSAIELNLISRAYVYVRSEKYMYSFDFLKIIFNKIVIKIALSRIYLLTCIYLYFLFILFYIYYSLIFFSE